MPSKVHVSRAKIDQFTFIVRLPPGCAITSSWLEEQQQAILDLQPSLLKSKNLTIRMIERFSHDRAELCCQHRKLNPLVIRKLFEDIQLECTTRMTPFKTSPTAPKDLAIQQWRKRVIGINSLWTEKETFYHLHQAEKGDPIHQQVKGDCEACILATIGGDQQMLMDLYICANSRGRLDRRGQPICHMIEGWLDAMGILEHIYETTKPFYRLIRSERARMQRERHAERRVKNRERPSTAPERPPRPDERQKMNDDAAEDEKSEIIDLYIKRLSAMNGQIPYNKQPNDSRLSLHPAIRSHIGFDASTGKYSRVNPDEVPHIPQLPPQHRENAGLGRSNTVISRDSRNDPGAYEVFRSDSPVSDDSRNNSPDRNRHRKESKDDDQYSGSAYSRPSADQQPYDSGYQESSSIPSPRDRDHELNLRMNPTNADIGGPRSPTSPEMVKKKKGYRRNPPAADVQRNRQDAYSNLVGMPSAYEFAAAQQKLKTLYEFEPDSEDERKVEKTKV